MSVKKVHLKQSINKAGIIELVLAEYRIDPARFRQYLPNVAIALDLVFPVRQGSRNPYGLTFNERQHRQQALENIVQKVETNQIDRQDAIKALEHCAVLIEDDNLPYEIDRRLLIRLLGIILEKPISEITTETTVEILKDANHTIVSRISLIRGVRLNLTQNMNIVSILVIPQKIKERAKAMRFVPKTKLAQRTIRDHDNSSEDNHAAS